LIGVKPRERKRSKHYHRGCLGALTDAGIVLHITRERVRQLVNRQLARLGDGYSRADALEMVMKERLP
jgi:DNA-directed RNA polymerase sigma subunit (sigma70/sigma32)